MPVPATGLIVVEYLEADAAMNLVGSVMGDIAKLAPNDVGRRSDGNRPFDLNGTHVELVRETGDLTFTMPAVAERSGMSLRTLYRHFPSRNDLVSALATVADQVDALMPPTSLDEIEPWLIAAWTNLMADEALLRAQHLGAAGVHIRRKRTPLHRSATADVIDSLCPDLSASAKDDLIDVTLLLTSSTSLFEFLDVLDVDVERGAQLAARAVTSLIEANRRPRQ